MGFFNYFYDSYVKVGITGALLQDVFSAFLFTALFCTFEFSKKGVLRGFCQTCLNWIVIVVWNSLYKWALPQSNMGYMIAPVFIAVTLVLIYRKESLLDRIIWVSVYTAVTAYLVAILFPVTLWEMNTLPYGKIKCVTQFIKFAVTFILVFVLKKRKIGQLGEVSFHFIVLIEAISVIGYVLNLLSVAILNVPMDQAFSFNFYSSIALLIIELLAYLLFYSAAKTHSDKTALSLQEQRAQSEIRVLKNYELGYNRVRTVKHDIQNQYYYIASMLRQGQTAEALKYLDELNPENSFGDPKIYSQNNIINLALNFAEAKAEKADTAISIEVSVPAELGIRKTALAAILTNLFNNGVEACEKLPKEKRSVSITVNCVNNFLLIRVVNSILPNSVKEKNGRLVSTKKNSREHGFGVKIIKNLTEENGGCFEYTVEEERFIANVMLRLNGEDSEDKEEVNCEV